MHEDEFDMTVDVESAWARFRGRLADRLAAMEDDDFLDISVEVGADEGELAGATPYVQFVGWGEDLIRAETVSNAYLDEQFRLSGDDMDLLVDLGWQPPTYEPGDEPDSGSVNFHLDVERRESDRLAVMSVGALREVFGCAHPAFLAADGLELDPETAEPELPEASVESKEPIAVFPQGMDDLRELVDRALSEVFPESLRHDDDGDVPVACGSSMVYVRVASDRPAVDLYAEIVLAVSDPERASLEVGILNRTHPFAKFYLRDDQVVMTHRIYAWPFASAQLRIALEEMCQAVDDIAGDLASRVGGLRFLDPPSELAPSDISADQGDSHPAILGLLELLSDGPVEPDLVANMFAMDSELLTRQLTRLRSGVQQTSEHDPVAVVALLRRALRVAVEAQALSDRSDTGGRRRRRPTTHQLSLLPESELGSQDSLDSGLWERGVS